MASLIVTDEQMRDLLELVLHARRAEGLNPQQRDRLYKLYSALAAQSKTPQFEYMVVNVGTLLDINREIASYAKKGWEAVSHSACISNHNYTVLFRKEQK